MLFSHYFGIIQVIRSVIMYLNEKILIGKTKEGKELSILLDKCSEGIEVTEEERKIDLSSIKGSMKFK